MMVGFFLSGGMSLFLAPFLAEVASVYVWDS